MIIKLASIHVIDSAGMQPPGENRQEVTFFSRAAGSPKPGSSAHLFVDTIELDSQSGIVTLRRGPHGRIIHISNVHAELLPPPPEEKKTTRAA